jgi:hypothetical protein
MLVWILFFPREAAGATGTRLSLRPLFSWANEYCIARTLRAARMRGLDRICRHCEERTRGSNPFFLYAAKWIASLALAMTTGLFEI